MNLTDRAGTAQGQKVGNTLLRLTATALLWIAGTSLALAGDIPGISQDPFNVLDPDEAFVIEAEPAGPDSVAINFSIEPGHYLYRKKMAVLSDHPGLQISETETLTGIETYDEFFGQTEIYRDSTQVVAHFRYQPPAGEASASAAITLQYQGCADIGICYPPQEKILSIDLPTAAAAQSSEQTTEPLALANLSSLIGDDEDEQTLLSPEVAFLPSVGTQSADKLSAQFAIEEGYYLYRDKMGARLVDAAGASISEVQVSAGKLKDDPYFGRVEILRDTAELTLSLAGIDTPTDAALSIDYQGCADIGVCFPPQTTVLPVSLSPVATDAAADNTALALSSNSAANSTGGTGLAAQSAPQAQLTEQDRIASTLSNQSIWIVIATFFGLGLLLAFTPCVFPMVPILSSLIVGQGDQISTRKAFALSLTYVLAMALTYTIAGVVVGLTGENIQIWFQNPWVLSVFALLFVLLALSMFGFYELQMPNAIQLRLNKLSNNAEGGTFIGAGIMGLLSALVVGPCVTAPLVGALIFIANTGDALVGGAALFALSMGMGAPLLLIGASCGRLLPRSGAWMDITKAVFGVLLLALAIWMLSRILPPQVTLALSAALLIVSGIYLGATDSLSDGVSGWRKLSKGLGLVVLIYGMSLLVGALSGGSKMLQPLHGLFAASGDAGTAGDTHGGELVFQRIASVEELQQVVASAAGNQQSVMLDFYADWCVSCKEMEAFTFTDAGVQQRLANTVLIQADVTANNDNDKALLKKFGLFGPPGIIFYAPDGTEIRNARMVGFMSAEKFSMHLDRFL